MSGNLIQEKKEIESRYGEWTTPIEFPFEKQTKHSSNVRKMCIAQLASDLATKPLSSCRVLDLGCRVALPRHFSKGDLRYRPLFAALLKRKLVNINHRLKQIFAFYR